jgi:hypothetical protein
MIQPDLGHCFEVLLRQIGSFCFSVLSETGTFKADWQLLFFRA